MFWSREWESRIRNSLADRLSKPSRFCRCCCKSQSPMRSMILGGLILRAAASQTLWCLGCRIGVWGRSSRLIRLYFLKGRRKISRREKRCSLLLSRGPWRIEASLAVSRAVGEGEEEEVAIGTSQGMGAVQFDEGWIGDYTTPKLADAPGSEQRLHRKSDEYFKHHVVRNENSACHPLAAVTAIAMAMRIEFTSFPFKNTCFIIYL